MKRFLQTRIKEHHKQIHRVGRFLVTGVWNTVFGITVFSVLLWMLQDKVNYLLLMIPANIIAITNAYICHKIFVFKTKGNILYEYFRFYLVYGSSMLLSFAVMFCLVDGLGISPFYSQFPCIAIVTLFSYTAHHKFSFKSNKPREDT